MLRWNSFLGLFVIVFLAWVLSSDRKRFPWRVVGGGILLQFLLAWFVLQTSIGQRLFAQIGNAFTAMMAFTDQGSRLVFPSFPGFPESHFAFRVLPTIILVSSPMSVLYYFGVMQRVVQFFSWIMEFTLGTSGPETLSASAIIFMGPT